MSLKVWLPLNGDLHNQGLSNIDVTNSGATVNAAGKIGKCYHFGTAQSYMTMPKEAMTSFTTECSIALWLKIKTWNTSYATFFQAGLGGAPWAHYIFGLLRNNANSTMCFTIGNGSYASGEQYLTSTLELNKWYHITLTYKTGECKIYLNGDLDHAYSTSIVPAFSSITHITLGCCNTLSSYQTDCDINDLRIYDECLSAAEIKEIARGLVLHYKLDGSEMCNMNLGGTSADYSNKAHGVTTTAYGWGGDAGTATFYHYGGYNGLPYKVYHKTATGSGGIYYRTDSDIILEPNTTYTMSIWIKADIEFNANHYSFNINRAADNFYITYGVNFPIHTTWTRYVKTFTTGENDGGVYGEMSIIYYDDVVDYNVYYSGFKIEEGSMATDWTPPGVPGTSERLIQDSSGYNNNGQVLNTFSFTADTPIYSSSLNLPAGNSMVNCGRGAMVTDSITVNLWCKYSTWANPISCTESGGWNFENASSATAAGITFPIYITSIGYIYAANGEGAEAIAAADYKDAWHMWTGVYNRVEKYVALYLDGELKQKNTSISASNLIKYNTKNSIWLGAEATSYATSATNGMVGSFSDVRIYCTPLLDNDIKQLYNLSMKVDNQQNIHTFEFKEQNTNIVNDGAWASSIYATSNVLESFLTTFNENGEMELSGNSKSIGSKYIPVIPGIYEYDYTVSINAGNQFYLGFERYDASKTDRSNAACVYTLASKPSSDIVKKRYKGTIDLTTDGVNPIAYIALRILSGWYGTTSGVTGQATIHNLSLRLLSAVTDTQLTKQKQLIGDELKESTKASIYKDHIIEASHFIER